MTRSGRGSLSRTWRSLASGTPGLPDPRILPHMSTPFSEQLRPLALGFPGAFEDYPFGDGETVYKAANAKMFAMCPADPEAPFSVVLKLTPEEAEAALTLPFVSPAPYLARYSWVAALVSSPIEFDIMLEWLARSHELVTAKGSKRKRS